jgi:hypothetical protein
MMILILARAASAQSTIVVERNGYCFGSCATYTLGIDQNGLVTFSGNAEVKTAHATRHISRSAVDSIVAHLKSAGFFELDADAYSPGHAGCNISMTDTNGGAITVFQNGVTTAVKYYRGCIGDLPDKAPREVVESAMRHPAAKLLLMDQLVSYIDSVAGTDEWVKSTMSARAKPIHHFVYFGADRDAMRSDTLFLNTPGIEGAQIRYFWSTLERNKDQYDFRPIESDMEFLRAHGKKLWVQLNDVSFSPTRNPVPKYLLEDTVYHGGAEMTWSVEDEANPIRSGWIARRWDPAVQERFQKLLLQLGAEFDGKIAGINLPETALEYGSTGKLFPPGFTHEAYRDAIVVNLRALRLAFSKSVAMQYGNFMPGEWRAGADKGYLSRIYSVAESIGAAVGGPDLMPYNRSQLVSSYPLLEQHANRMTTGIAVQDGNLAEINPETKQKVTAKELLDFAMKTLRVDYIFWQNDERYYSKEIIPLIRQH